MGAERCDGAAAAPDVRLELTHGPGGPGVLADGRALPVPPQASPTEVGLAAARRHAARSARELRVAVVDGASVTLVTVGRHGTVTLLEPPPTGPVVTAPAFRTVAVEPVTEADRTSVHLAPPVVRARPPRTTPPTSLWVTPTPAERPRRPVSSLVVASLVAVAVLVGAVGTGVATLSSAQALPDACRPVTLYAVGGQGGSADVLRGVTDPLAKQFGEKVSVVTVPPPPAGGSFASAESEAVGSLAVAMGEHVDGCPTGSLMLFGYSQGAQVAGDLASRIGTGLEPRIPAKLVQAVGLFGDPARSPRTRAVPDGTTGQGALPPRAVGFGSLDARTIEVCAPDDPVCDSPPTAAAPPLEQAVASPVHGSYEKLPVAAGTTAPQWAATSLSKVVAAIPTGAGPATTPPGTAPQSGSGGTTGSEEPDADATGAGAATEPSDPATAGSGEAGAETTTPPAGRSGGSYEDGGSAGDGGSSAVTPTNVPSGSSATGGGGAGVSTRRSGSASSDGADASGSTGSGSGGTRSRGSGSDTSGPVSSGQGSADTSAPSSSRTGSGATGSSGEYGTGAGTGAGSAATGTGTAGTRSSAPSSERSASGSASEDPTTTSAAPSSRSRDGEKADKDKDKKKEGGKDKKDGEKDKDKDKNGRTKTGASFSLAGGLEGFKSTPWNNQGATDPSSAASPNVPGRKAVKFEMPGGGKRTEAEPDIPEFTAGEKSFVGYSGFFDQGFPTNTDTWQLIMQFKQPGTGSPPLAVEVGKGQLRLANDGGGEKDFCPVTQGAFSFQLGVTFGGAIDAWCNGKQTLTGYTTPKSNVQGSAYLKTGIYRDESIKQDSTLFLNDLKVGKTLESVSGLAGAGSGTDTAATAATAATSDPPTSGTSDQAAGTDPTAPTTAAPAAAAPATAPGTGTADALGTVTGAGSSGTGTAAADASSYFTGGAVGPPLPGPRPRRTEGS